MRAIALPILKEYHAYHIFYEADNIWALFDTPSDAVRAGFEFVNAVKVYNESVDEMWHIKLSGVGFCRDNEFYIDQDGKFFGNGVDRAFRIGEDLVEDSEICVSDVLKKSVEDALPCLAFKADEDEETGLVYWHVTGDVRYICPEGVHGMVLCGF